MKALIPDLYQVNNPYKHPGDIVDDIDIKKLKGTKVTFINLPIREQAVPNNPPMGPALLAARLKNMM